jgi:hypothetical protein
MYGDEIGIGPMTALQGVHIIEGRPFMSAELMRALVLGAGHRMRVIESTGTRCVVMGWRREDVPYTEAQGIRVEWTIEMARAAGLAGRGSWHRYPRALLLARASADLCRMAFADVVRGLGHIPESPDAADVSDWTEYAESLGPEPATPAPARTETVQWTRAEKAAGDRMAAGVADDEDVSTALRPTPASNRAPWENDDDDDASPETGETTEATQAPGSEPEPVAAEDPEARLVDEPGITRIMAAYGDLTYGPDRDTRLGLFSAIVGRPIESTKDLERMEAFRLLGALYDLKLGRTIAVDDGHGAFTIHAGAEPPDEE